MRPPNDIPNQREATPRPTDEPAAAAAGDDDRRGEPATDPEALREEIAATREHLGETVQALADKADVKARARERIDEGKQQAAQAAEQAAQQVRRRPIHFAAAGAFVVGVVVGVILRHRS